MKKAKCVHSGCRRIATVLMTPPPGRPLSRTPLCGWHVEQFERAQGLGILARCEKGFEVERQEGYDHGYITGVTYIPCDGSGKRF